MIQTASQKTAMEERIRQDTERAYWQAQYIELAAKRIQFNLRNNGPYRQIRDDVNLLMTRAKILLDLALGKGE